MSLNTGSSSPLSERALLILVELEHGSLPAATLKRKMEQAYALSIEPGAFYKTLTRLERKGWIEPADAGTLLHPHSYGLTERGQAMLHQHRDLASQRRERILTTAGGNTSLRGGIMKLVTWIVKLYPRAWRERYEIEMLALLEEHPITFLTVFDLLFGVMDARLDPHYRTERALSAFKRPRIATLAFFAALAVFLFLVQGNMLVIMLGIMILFGPGQSIVHILNVQALMQVPIYGLLCLITMLVAFVSMKRIVAARRIGTALFAVACFVVPIVLMLLLNTLAFTDFFIGASALIPIRGNNLGLWAGLESLMGMLLLTILKGKQAIATRKKGLLFLIILIDALLVLRTAGFLLLWSPPRSLSFLYVFTMLTMNLFPFTTIGVLLLALAGSAFGEWIKRLVLASVGLVILIMIVYLPFFLVGSWSWTQRINVSVINFSLPYTLFSDQLPIGVTGVGLLLCILLVLAAFRSLLPALKRTPVTKAAIQEVPPMEMRQ